MCANVCKINPPWKNFVNPSGQFREKTKKSIVGLRKTDCSGLSRRVSSIFLYFYFWFFFCRFLFSSYSLSLERSNSIQFNSKRKLLEINKFSKNLKVQRSQNNLCGGSKQGIYKGTPGAIFLSGWPKTEER